MAETTVSDLKVRLEAIRDERSTHANTAHRIGSAMLELLSYVETAAASVDLSQIEAAIAQKINLANLTELLTPLDSQMNPIGWNAATLVNTKYLCANVDFFSKGGVSALGAGSSGGGGGGGLTESLSWNYGSVVSASGGSYDGSASKSLVIPKKTSDLTNDSGFITSLDVNKTGQGLFNKIPFVNGGGSMDIGNTLEFHASSGDDIDYGAVIKLSSSEYYTQNPVLIIPNKSGTIALKSDLDGFLTSETYRGTVTSVAMAVPTGFSVSGSPITSSGTLALSFASGYSLPTTAKQSEWNTAYANSHAHTNKSVLDNISSAKVSNWDSAYDNQDNYLLKSQGMRFTNMDSYIAARFTTATGVYDSDRAEAAQGNGYIEWWSTGGYFNFRLGRLEAKDNVIVGTNTSDTTHYLQIGGGRIYWDDTYKSLYVQQADGTACNLVATGGVSALGVGVASPNSLTLGSLAVTNTATLNYVKVGDGGILFDDADGASSIYSSGGSLMIDIDTDMVINGELNMNTNDITNAGSVSATSLHTGMVYMNQDLAALAYNKNTGQLVLRTRTSISGSWTNHVISMT